MKAIDCITGFIESTTWTATEASPEVTISNGSGIKVYQGSFLTKPDNLFNLVVSSYKRSPWPTKAAPTE